MKCWRNAQSGALEQPLSTASKSNIPTGAASTDAHVSGVLCTSSPRHRPAGKRKRRASKKAGSSQVFLECLATPGDAGSTNVVTTGPSITSTSSWSGLTITPHPAMSSPRMGPVSPSVKWPTFAKIDTRETRGGSYSGQLPINIPGCEGRFTQIARAQCLARMGESRHWSCHETNACGHWF